MTRAGGRWILGMTGVSFSVRHCVILLAKRRWVAR
jgi:hypothetical protein